MPNRKCLVSTLWLITSLALLASVMVAPIRTPALPTVSSRTDCLRRNFARPPGQPTTLLREAMAMSLILEANALSPEEEEQHRDNPQNESRATFRTPGSFRKIADHQLSSLGSIDSRYPLRC